MEKITLPAPAKINLALDIKGVRPDEYHIVEMIMQTVGLCDYITLKKSKGGIKIFSSDERLPDDSSNLAYQAAELILEDSGLEEGVDIYIEKNIPLAAGLAGGSTDAAAVLKGINQLFQTGFNNDNLKEMGSKLGSDVPFCIRGGTAFASGRGERIRQLPDLGRVDLIIITPPVEVSTASVYQKYDRTVPESKMPVSNLVKLIEKRELIKWDEGWFNILEPVTTTFVHDVLEIKELLRDKGVKFSLMSGSGPTVFGIVEDSEKANFISQNWPRKEDFVFPTRTIKQDFEVECRNY